MRGINPRGMSGAQVSDWFGPSQEASIPSRPGAGVLVQSVAGSSAAPGATYTLNFNREPTPGNLLVCIVLSTTVASAGPSGFTLRNSIVAQKGVYLYTRTAQVGDGTSVTWDPNGNYETLMVIAELRGLAYASGSTLTTQTTTNQTSRSHAALSTGGAQYLLITGAVTLESGYCWGFEHAGGLLVGSTFSGYASLAAFTIAPQSGSTTWESGIGWNTYSIAARLDAA